MRDVVVDGGSTDGTQELAAAPGPRASPRNVEVMDGPAMPGGGERCRRGVFSKETGSDALRVQRSCHHRRRTRSARPRLRRARAGRIHLLSGRAGSSPSSCVPRRCPTQDTPRRASEESPRRLELRGETYGGNEMVVKAAQARSDRRGLGPVPTPQGGEAKIAVAPGPSIKAGNANAVRGRPLSYDNPVGRAYVVPSDAGRLRGAPLLAAPHGGIARER